MKTINLPKVYLIAKTALCGNGLSEYLKDIGNPDWAPDNEVSDGENLIEAAGRMCYRSWQAYDPNKPEATNLNVTRVREGNKSYIGNVLKSGHGCYDEETEVLTIDGWKKWNNIEMKDKLATRKQDGIIEYHHPIKILDGVKYSGKMYKVESSGVDLLVTPNHRMFVCKTTTVKGRKRNNESYEFINAEDLNDKSHTYVKSGLWNPKDIKGYSFDIGALLGFSIGDGSLSYNKINFHIKKERKTTWLKSLCKRLNWLITFKEKKDTYIVDIDEKYLTLFKNIYNQNKEKVIPEKCLTHTSNKFLNGLYEGLIQSDGSVSDTAIIYDTTSKELADQFQQLCLHLGYAANIEKEQDRKGSFGSKRLYRLSVIRRNLKPEVNKHKGQVGRTNWIENWDGKVYCAEVPNGTLYVRRNGKPVWCGNSILEHVNMTVIMRNVSRVVTHEMTRHRAGMAFSQESLRYVRLDDLNFWLPEAAKNNPEAKEKFEEVVTFLEGVQGDLAKMFDIDNLSSFHEKKQLTSMFRRLAPIGLGTSIVVTGNLRAWRHIIAMRSSEAAEEEIRIVADQIAQICKGEYPNVFQDMEKNPITNEWEFKNEKV